VKHIKNEKGNSLVYLLWIFTATIVLFLIVTNIARVYIVKQQASSAAELAALAATGEILSATKDAIEEFDEKMEELTPEGTIYKPLWKDIEKKVDSYKSSGDSEQVALVKAYNELLPDRFGEEPIDLRQIILKSMNELSFQTKVQSTVENIVKKNEGNEEHVEVKISTSKFRVEVKTDATYKTLTDGDLLASFSKDIPQEGIGPKLLYLKEVLN